MGIHNLYLPVSKPFCVGSRCRKENKRPAIGDVRSAMAIRESELADDGWRIGDGRSDVENRYWLLVTALARSTLKEVGGLCFSLFDW